ncbi:MAG: hypothetical protein ACOC7T_05680 [Planctomycetota bacterium]
MGGGFFTEGTTSLELGDHVFTTPAAARLNLLNVPPGAPARVLDTGGGVLELTVTAQCVRENLGDAERYIHEKLHALAGAGPGVLGVEDPRGNSAIFGDAVCVSAQGRVRALRFVEMELEFAAPERSAQPSWQAPPDPPATYPGTSTAQDYAADGVPLGTHPAGMRIEMAHEFPLREVPRARGARATGPAAGAVIRFVVTSHLLCGDEHLADHLEELAGQIGPRQVTLTGNGNTWEGTVLDSLRPVHTDGRHTRFEATFLKRITD